VVAIFCSSLHADEHHYPPRRAPPHQWETLDRQHQGISQG
jgi:hypothetical protein